MGSHTISRPNFEALGYQRPGAPKNSRRVLVTGAGGYIGSTLVPMLLESGYHVRAVDRFFFGRNLLPDDDKLEVVREDARYLDQSHLGGVDAVIDLVAISNDPSADAFQEATWAINRDARVRMAHLAKASGVKRYVLPSSCSIYGFVAGGALADETAATNPLTTYARANEKAEHGVLPLADENFCVVVLRLSTAFGYSRRMRFDLAINGMTFGAWKHGRLPLNRDGTQWRPMVHVRDAARAQIFMLEAPACEVNGRVFNVGSARNTYQIGPLAKLVAERVPRPVEIEWYGEPDHRSYRVSFERIERLGYQAETNAEEGIAEICHALDKGLIDKTPQTITLEWYKMLEQWHGVLRDVELHGGVVNVARQRTARDGVEPNEPATP